MKTVTQTASSSLPGLPGSVNGQISCTGQSAQQSGKTHLFKKSTTRDSEKENGYIKPITPIAQPIRDQAIASKALPLTSTVSKNVSGRLSTAGSNFGSPIPCGDSFFEDDAVLTQTHVDFMSKFKRLSLPGSSISGNNNLSSPTSSISSPIIKGQNMYKQSPEQVSNQSVIHGQKKPNFLNQSDSFISPNRSRSNGVGGNSFNNFDSIDDEMNLELAEQSDFDFDYKISSVAHPAAKKCTEKGDNFNTVSVKKGNNPGADNFEKGGNYDLLDESGQDMFGTDDFGDDDEDFAEILDCDDNLPAISHNSRESNPSAGIVSRFKRAPIYAYAKPKAQICFAVTAKLISAFDFATWIVQFLFFINLKFPASMLVQLGLCRTCLFLLVFS